MLGWPRINLVLLLLLLLPGLVVMLMVAMMMMMMMTIGIVILQLILTFRRHCKVVYRRIVRAKRRLKSSRGEVVVRRH